MMETSLRLLGEEHPDTLTTISNLASTYSNQGQWKKAEELQVQVMESRKRLLGDEHPYTLTSISNLASAYSNQGQWKKAEGMEVQVMETRKRLLGADHPDTLQNMSNLASIFGSQRQWKEAEELEVQVMETRKRLLGAEHSDTLASIGNLSTYKNQRLQKAAEELVLSQVAPLSNGQQSGLSTKQRRSVAPGSLSADEELLKVSQVLYSCSILNIMSRVLYQLGGKDLFLCLKIMKNYPR
jgi:tetratricopeptide (TPR) repeat protein